MAEQYSMDGSNSCLYRWSLISIGAVCKVLLGSQEVG